MNIDDTIILDTISADSIEIGDQVIIEGDYIEVTYVGETDDIDEIVVKGFSHETGGKETYSLYADDYYQTWAV